MSHHNADAIVHINETLDEMDLLALEDEISENVGVVCATHNPKFPHLMMVDYDSDMMRSTDFLGAVRGHGLHAQLVGF